jgi:hypothetical protein
MIINKQRRLKMDKTRIIELLTKIDEKISGITHDEGIFGNLRGEISDMIVELEEENE